MKKLLIIITLFVSSFFLFCNKEVKAAEFTYNYDFSIFTEDFFNIRNKFLDFIKEDTESSDFYIIYYNNGTIEYFILPLGSDISKAYVSVGASVAIVYSSSLQIYNKNYNNISGSLSQLYVYLSSNCFIIDSNIAFNFKNNGVGSTITFNFTDYSHSLIVTEGLKLPTLYDLYKEYNDVEQENPHHEEIDKVTNFYTMVIEKLSYLAEQIVSNYILLFIIGIFILIFIFMLIFRRFIC